MSAAESVLPGVTRVIKLSSNEGAFGPPASAVAALAEAGAKMHRYPDGGMAKLRAAIGAAFGLDPARIVCGNGSDELLTLLIQAYGGPGTELIMSAHGFSIYEISGKLIGLHGAEGAGEESGCGCGRDFGAGDAADPDGVSGQSE